jgi:hypothetical protein
LGTFIKVKDDAGFKAILYRAIQQSDIKAIFYGGCFDNLVFMEHDELVFPGGYRRACNSRGGKEIFGIEALFGFEAFLAPLALIGKNNSESEV